MRAALLLALLAAHAHADVAVETPGRVWFETTSSARADGYSNLDTTALRWMAGARMVWRHALSPRWRKRAVLEAGYVADAELAQGTVARGYHPLVRRDALVLADDAGLAVFALADGALRFEWSGPGERMVWLFNRAEVTIADRGAECRATAQSGWFLVDCNQRLYLFNGHHVVAFDTAPYRLLEIAPVKAETKNGRIKDVRAHVVVAGASVDVHGLIYD